jgi:hypothetical protein
MSTGEISKSGCFGMKISKKGGVNDLFRGEKSFLLLVALAVGFALLTQYFFLSQASSKDVNNVFNLISRHKQNLPSDNLPVYVFLSWIPLPPQITFGFLMSLAIFFIPILYYNLSKIYFKSILPGIFASLFFFSMALFPTILSTHIGLQSFVVMLFLGVLYLVKTGRDKYAVALVVLSTFLHNHWWVLTLIPLVFKHKMKFLPFLPLVILYVVFLNPEFFPGYFGDVTPSQTLDFRLANIALPYFSLPLNAIFFFFLTGGTLEWFKGKTKKNKDLIFTGLALFVFALVTNQTHRVLVALTMIFLPFAGYGANKYTNSRVWLLPLSIIIILGVVVNLIFLYEIPIMLSGIDVGGLYNVFYIIASWRPG